ncbi:MAG: 50S ribosomal protein L11 methyltransferase, partial [Prosthecobacter sp.]|nr:50S ribosomal protein L11 methyltransferase [Prosthecobacter sp.]
MAFSQAFMFVWSKLSATKWSDAWEERFAGSNDATLVISSFPGRQTIRVEVYCATEKRARAIQKEWGGSVRQLKQQNWAAHASQAPPPVKVREKFVVCTARTNAELTKARKEFPN